jgi:hypothetical protein
MRGERGEEREERRERRGEEMHHLDWSDLI